MPEPECTQEETVGFNPRPPAWGGDGKLMAFITSLPVSIRAPPRGGAILHGRDN